MKKFAKYLGWTLAIGAGLALIASIVILIAAQHHAELSDVVISLGDTEIAVHGLFDQPILTILVAWLSVAAAFLIAGLGVMFALLVATLGVVFALGITAVSLGGVALLLASPFIAIAAIVWLIVRNSRKSDAGSATPPPAAAA
jgi:hypothetical protein